MTRNKCLEVLHALAKACNFDLSATLVGIYDQSLKRNGYDSVYAALIHVLQNRRQRDQFPTIREIQELITPMPEAQDLAKSAAARVIAGVSKFGRYNCGEAEAYIGELGWKCVEQIGGWANLCQQLTMDNTSVFMAQLRELAGSVYRQAQLGKADEPPRLPEARKPLAALVKQLSSKLDVGGSRPPHSADHTKPDGDRAE